MVFYWSETWLEFRRISPFYQSYIRKFILLNIQFWVIQQKRIFSINLLIFHNKTEFHLYMNMTILLLLYHPEIVVVVFQNLYRLGSFFWTLARFWVWGFIIGQFRLWCCRISKVCCDYLFRFLITSNEFPAIYLLLKSFYTLLTK